MGVNQGDVLALDLGRRDRMDTGLRRYDGGEERAGRAESVAGGRRRWRGAVMRVQALDLACVRRQRVHIRTCFRMPASSYVEIA